LLLSPEELSKRFENVESEFGATMAEDQVVETLSLQYQFEMEEFSDAVRSFQHVLKERGTRYVGSDASPKSETFRRVIQARIHKYLPDHQYFGTTHYR